MLLGYACLTRKLADILAVLTGGVFVTNHVSTFLNNAQIECAYSLMPAATNAHSPGYKS